MALSNAERQRRYQARKRAQLENAPDLTRPYLRTPFYKFMTSGDWSGVIDNLGLIGLRLEPFTDDSDARAHAGKFVDQNEEQYEYYERYTGSVGRAEYITGLLLDAALEFAGRINAYKKQELDRAIVRLGAQIPTTSQDQKEALATLLKLTKFREQLDTFRRIEIPQYLIKEQL